MAGKLRAFDSHHQAQTLLSLDAELDYTRTQPERFALNGFR